MKFKLLLSTILIASAIGCGSGPDAASEYCNYWAEKAVTCGFMSAEETNPESCADAVRAWGQSEEYVKEVHAGLANATCDEWADAVMGGE